MATKGISKVPVVTILVKYSRCRICGNTYESVYDHGRSLKAWRQKQCKVWKAIYVGWCNNC